MGKAKRLKASGIKKYRDVRICIHNPDGSKERLRYKTSLDPRVRTASNVPPRPRYTPAPIVDPVAVPDPTHDDQPAERRPPPSEYSNIFCDITE